MTNLRDVPCSSALAGEAGHAVASSRGGAGCHCLNGRLQLSKRLVAIEHRPDLQFAKWAKRVLDHYLVERRLVGHGDDREAAATPGEELKRLCEGAVAFPPGSEG